MDNFNPEVQRALEDMFASEGWRYFLEDVTANKNGVNHLDGIEGEQMLGFRQGQVSILNSVLAYEDAIRSASEAEGTDE